MTDWSLEGLKAKIRHARASVFLPQPTSTEGSALMKDVSRFAGPGWSGAFRTRPTTPFDLAAKIHDIHYAANRIDFFKILRVRATRAQSESDKDLLSRAAKADHLFMIMNDLEPPWQPGSKALNYSAKLAFVGDQIVRFARRKDGFINVLLDADLLSELNDPQKYFMIPESEIPRLSSGRGPRISYALQETRLDRHPGFALWVKTRYLPIWERIKSVTSDPLTEGDIVGASARPMGSSATRVTRCY